MTKLLKILLALRFALLLAACSSGDPIEVGADAPEFTLPDDTSGEVSL